MGKEKRGPEMRRLNHLAVLVAAVAAFILSSVYYRLFAQRSATALTGLPVAASAVAIVSVFFAIRYLFASNAAHTTAALPAFLAVLTTVPGMPVKAVALTLVYSIGLMGVLTPYATGPAPVWYGAGYIGARDFWKLGFVMGALYLGTVLAIGLPTAMRFMP